MGTPVSLQPTLSVEVIKSYSTTTAYAFKCEWSGCDAKLNCWINLQKHYHWHCKHTQKNPATHTCEVRFCTIDKSRRLSLSSLMEHINKVHLSRVHIPCPVAGCHIEEFLDRIYIHFQNNHDNHLNMTLAPQAFPFRPAPVAIPLPPLPRGSVPTYKVLPSLVVPGRRKTKVIEQESTPNSNKVERHLTFWSCFEFGEALDGREEQKMRDHDLDFQPLHYPVPLSGKDPWPAFAISAEPADMSHMKVVSTPPVVTGIAPASKSDPPAPRNFFYQAFKRYLEEKSF